MTDILLTTLSMENPSTLLSMDSGLMMVGEDCEGLPSSAAVPRPNALCRPPDINLPLSAEITPPSWFADTAAHILEVGCGGGGGGAGGGGGGVGHDLEILSTSKSSRRLSGRRGDIIWGAWFFFSHYFRPAVTEKCKMKLSREGGVSASSQLDKSDMRLDIFLVQHDMENMYMWVFKERPENALGKMQLRSYMNGASKFGDPQFPFSSDKGFVRSHRMQRKHYRGLSNPQCIHGIEVVRSPSFSNSSEEDKARWMDLTGRDLNTNLPVDAEAFSSWRSLPSTDFDLDRSTTNRILNTTTNNSNNNTYARTKRPSSKLIINDNNHPPTLDLSTKLPSSSTKKKQRKELSSGSSEECCIGGIDMYPLDVESDCMEQPPWLSDFTGVMTEACGPVTGAKSIYEDEEGYLIMVSLPFTDIQRVRVSWLNMATHGIVKIHCTSNARTPYIQRGDRMLKLTDASPEHCPPGDFVREIALPTRIPENAELKAFYAEVAAGLEIMVPKHHAFSEEREVRVFLPPQLGHSESLLS